MRGRKKVGFVTIGQSPRDDILAELIPLLPKGVEILQAGALDGLRRKDIEVLTPGPRELPLISRLKDTSSVVVGRQKVLPRVKAKVEELENRGADIIALLCTEDFFEISSKKPLLLPYRLMKSEAEKRQGTRKITVIVPLESQEKAAREKWAHPGVQLNTAVLNPYAGLREHDLELKAFQSRISRIEPDLLVYDCLGFSLSFCQRIARKTHLPFLSPRLCLAKHLEQLL